MKRSGVFAIGQLPPPVSGFSLMTARVIEDLARVTHVEVSDISAAADTRGIFRHASRLWRTIRTCVKMRYSRRVCRVSYVACEGDWGIIYTIIVVVTARMSGYDIVLHHHSFGYINQNRLLIRLLLSMGGNIRHIFLCERMRSCFEARYRRSTNYSIVSNLTLVPPPVAVAAANPEAPLTIGLLSNLNRAKGLHIYLDLVRALHAEGRVFRAILAGPASIEDRHRIEEVVVQTDGALTYWGALHGPKKDAFFFDIDVFVFPSLYANEAEPVVIYEARAAGALIVAFERGCIGTQIGQSDRIVRQADDFVQCALEYTREIDRSLELCRRTRAARIEQYASLRQQAVTAVSAVLDRRMGG